MLAEASTDNVSKDGKSGQLNSEVKWATASIDLVPEPGMLVGAFGVLLLMLRRRRG